MAWTRRRVLAGASAMVGAACAEAGRTQGRGVGPPLPIPPLVDARRAAGPIELIAAPGEMQLLPGARSLTAGYNGAYLGPTLRVRSGDDVEFHVQNRLDEDTTVHWHGLLVPSGVDGGPHNVIAPGASWRPTVPVRQPASTVWYHAHPHPRTGPQVYSGLAGMLIVGDEAEARLGLPSDYGVDDLPLILQDRLFDASGALVYPQHPMALMQGVRGDVFLVNGAPTPTARPPSGPTRLRLLNGANARIFDLAFEDGRTFHWIGTEGGLLRAPVPLTRLSLAPGQRAEVIVDFSDGRAAALATAPDDNLPMMMGRGMGRGMRGPGPMMGGASAAGGTVLRFEPRGAPTRRPAALPATLASWSRPDPARASRRRRLNLTMGMGMGMGRGRMGGMGGLHGIDGRPFDMSRIDQTVRLGDIEIWEVSGELMRHPFHMHGVHFEVLSRGGREPAEADLGRRDTILVQEPVELVVQFTQPARREPFMYHCHIFEHEDHGMMGQFRVV